MCIMIDGEDVRIMSAVIAVCGTNFCTFAADRRMVIPDKNTFRCANDETDKIFKVNDRVLLGMTGIFWRWEHLTDPLDGCADLLSMSAAQVKDVVVAYLDRPKTMPFQPRNYLIGGTEAGSFVIYEVHYDGRIKVNKRTPLPPMFNFALSVSLPHTSENLAPHVQTMVASGLQRCSAHHELIPVLRRTLTWLSEQDDTIGPTQTVLSILSRP